MTSDDFDDIYDVPPPSEVPVLQPLHPNEMSREELRAKYLKPGFGFWMSGVWCVLYLIATQLLVGLGVAIVGVVIVVAIMADPQGGVGMDAKQLNADPKMIIVMVCAMVGAHFAGILFSMLMLRWVVGKTWKRRIALTRLPSLTHMAILLIGFPALLALIGLIQEPVMKYVPSVKDLFDMPGLDDFMKSLPTWPLFVAIFAVAVLPGVGEELWCRGFIGHGTSARYGFVYSALITSFYFGAIHIEPPQAILAMMIGLVIHSVYVLSRSLLACMAMHFANNALVVLHEGKWARVLTPIEEVAEKSPFLLMISAILLLGAVAYALYQTRCKLAPVEPGMPTWEPKGVSSVELPPSNSGTIVTHDPISTLSVFLVLTGAVIFGMVLAFA